MDNNQKKEKFIQDQVENFTNGVSSIEQSDVKYHNFFMEMVPSGKLYRYRSFNNNNLENLKNHVLYCSNPMFFNDPFDCHIGADPREYALSNTCYEIKIVYEIIKNCYEIIIAQKKTPLKKDEFRLFKKWSQNSKIMEFVEKCAIAPCDQFEYTVFDNKDIFMKIVNDVSSLKSVQQKNPNLKDTLFSSIYSFDIEDPVSREILFQTLENTKNEYKKALTSIVTKLSCIFGIASFSTKYTNRLMWSHYADGHKGFCVEYDFSDLSYREGCTLPVIYSKKRPTIPWDSIYRRSQKDFDKIKSAYIRALLTKDDIWEYEDEWRLFIDRNLTNEKMQDIEIVKGLTAPSPPVSHIYIGALCDKDNYEKIKKIANEQNIPFSRLGIDPVEFKLNETNDFSIYENKII